MKEMTQLECNYRPYLMLLGFKLFNIKSLVRFSIAAVSVFILMCSILTCSRAPSEPAKPLPTDPTMALWWLPSGIRFINHQGVGQMTLINGTRKRLKNRSEDFERLANQVDHWLMLSRFLGEPTLNAVHGFSDRDGVENRLKKVFHELTGLSITYQRDGAITRASAGGGTRYLGWSNDGWLYFDKDRDRVESMLKRPSNPTLSPSFGTLLGRVSLDQKFWTVFAGDATGCFIGVPSVGFIQNSSLPESMGQLVATGFPLTFIFESEVEARRAKAALIKAGQNDNFPPPLRLALNALKPKIRGNEVDTDFATFMTDTAAMEAAISVMKGSVQ